MWPWEACPTAKLDKNGKKHIKTQSTKNKSVGKFRPHLIELTSFKPKLLIRFIVNKTC